MGVTLKEIAALAGVHRSTVDKVLHKRPGVSDEVRRRVQAVIDETGYRPNPVGRALQKQSAVIRLAAILLEVDARPFMERGIRKAVGRAAYVQHSGRLSCWRVWRCRNPAGRD